jgi:monovalent cation:H+ antiporter-2, CPA2 family
LMAIFFTVIGMKVNPVLLADHWWVIPLAVLAIASIKWLVIGGTGWLLGMSAPAAVLTGAYLATASEFTLVILGAGSAAGVLSAELYGACVAVVILSLLCSPISLTLGHRLVPRAQTWRLAGLFVAPGLRDDSAEPPSAKQSASTSGPDPASHDGNGVNGSIPAPRPIHVVIAGFGPVGRSLAESFDKLGMTYTVIDLNPRTAIRQGSLGRSIVYGDVTNPDVLERAGVTEADAVCLTIPDGDAVLRACSAIRQLAPSVYIAARTNFLSQALRAKTLGADHVIVEEIATAKAMEREVIERIKSRPRHARE